MLVVSSHPVIEGVVRLAADATPEIGRILTTRDLGTVEALIEAEQPDVIVIDIDQGPTSGLETVRAARRGEPGMGASSCCRSSADGQFVLETMRLGVQAFLRKPEGLA